jgi:hypothetical protein
LSPIEDDPHREVESEFLAESSDANISHYTAGLGPASIVLSSDRHARFSNAGLEASTRVTF